MNSRFYRFFVSPAQTIGVRFQLFSKNGSQAEMGVRFQLISSLKVTLEPPAMGTHFSGLSLKKWSPGRAALK
jgi:hypothetical protein